MSELKEKCTSVFDVAQVKLRELLTSHPDQFPMYTTQGQWDFSGETWTNWCEGFLGGQLWLITLHTQDPWWQEQAIHYSELVEPRKTDRTVHDLGFLFWLTWKRWYDLKGDPQANDVVIEAGRTLALRYNEKGKYFRSFLAADSLFIDIMMNVGIIFYAAQQTGNKNLYEKALQHCLTTRRFLVRGDGSTAHEGIFDLETGQFLGQSTQQGWRSDSCWARGLAWAIYGFTTVFSFTRDDRFIETAQACADFYMSHVPDHGIPPNDFDEQQPHSPYESSAAAIAASGLIDLAKHSGWVKYHDHALRILDTLTGPEFLADQSPGWEGLLKHGIYHSRKGLGVDESVMWGDYFMLEAVKKVLDE